ncbi:hypothetical protein RB2150_05408 [Rhodobacterales bacterium HTCC2150]|nr:hypothetical protein RB2150_05408 [Rhodobacterales bacterium HTCC2150] [Rhodobacteraceae bacterium HTCC2150]
MSDILIAAFGLVLVFEGLVFALAPSRLEDLIAAMSKITVDQRRTFGLIAVALGVGIVWVVL